MSVTYNKTNWVNDVTPLDANNMNNIENGIESLVNEVNGGTITVDSELSETSENPVQNKTITAELNNKADINNPLSLPEASKKNNGFILHEYTSSTGEEKYVLNPKDGATLDDTMYGKSKIPSSYVVGNYVKESVANKADSIDVRSVITQDSQEVFQGLLSADGTFTATTGANKQRTTDYIPLERNRYYKLNISYSDNASLVPRAVCVYNNDIAKTFSRAITISTTNMSKIQLTDNERYIRVNWSSTVDRLNIYQWQDGESGKEQKLSYVKRNNFDHATARKLQICFTFDGDYENNEAIHNVFVNHSAKHSFALIPQDTSFTNVPYEKYKEWEKDGVEILVHTSHIMNSTTYPNVSDGIAWLYEIDKRMKGYGFNVNGVVGSSGTIDDDYIPTIKKLWQYASSLGNSAGAEQAVHTFDESPFKLFRYGLQTSTLEEMKSAVDTAISQNGLLWFYGHCKNGEEGGNLTAENIDALLTYIESNNIEVVTPNKAIQDFYTITWDDYNSLIQKINASTQ